VPIADIATHGRLKPPSVEYVRLRAIAEGPSEAELFDHGLPRHVVRSNASRKH